jgi:hypothetical protein
LQVDCENEYNSFDKIIPYSQFMRYYPLKWIEKDPAKFLRCLRKVSGLEARTAASADSAVDPYIA